MPNRIDIVGQRFGRWFVVRDAPVRAVPSSQLRQVRARCDCGTVRVVLAQNLRRGTSKSCGCLNIESLRDRAAEDGRKVNGRFIAEYHSWRGMIERCENPRHKTFADYGGRGITICKRWRRSFPAFLADMGRKPSPTHSIDRKNNRRNYTPGNCRWATKIEQATNRRPRKAKHR
jgi:hypothetical protein